MESQLSFVVMMVSGIQASHDLMCGFWVGFHSLLGEIPQPSTHFCPDVQTDPLRKFYTSLLEENPDSAMAKKW
jgi:hypothetical protein